MNQMHVMHTYLDFSFNKVEEGFPTKTNFCLYWNLTAWYKSLCPKFNFEKFIFCEDFDIVFSLKPILSLTSVIVSLVYVRAIA